ncbi:arylsulfatase B-like [Odontomachus brunneus]|uniref:arylsulfatase B-like n=1 Tax=Odontomachus brunneus TaxID=486640 RepID=UPI0013F22306|nr:arylsulfatase B-like [Odontomachus brunneus]
MPHTTVVRSNALVLWCILLFGNALGLYKSAPHIIVFMADDLGWNDVGFHGSNQIPTPNIDALGYNGIILNRHYVLPSSTPSRAAFFTGLYPIRMGMQGEGIRGGEPRGLPLNIKILPEYLRGLGYTTKLIGKWHVGYHTPQHTPLHRGFDAFLGFYNSHVSYYDYKYSYQNMSGYDMHRDDNPAYGLTEGYATDLFTDEAMRIIQQHEPSRPLYLQISHLAVHAPLESPDDYHRNQDEEQFKHIRELNRRKYARMVWRLDESVGRIVHTLGDRGMLRDSLILFLTDNGAAPIGRIRNWGSNYPLRGMKYTLYEGGVRGVAVLWSPRLRKAARVCNNLVHITDWLPTFYSAAGGDLKDLGEIDGLDQWRMLSDDYPEIRQKLLLNIDEVSKTEGAIYKSFKLLRGSIEGGHYDGYYGDTMRYLPIVRKNKSEQIEVHIPYSDTILKSSVSQSITYHLGGPVTQPSTMNQLRLEATVYCYRNVSYYNSFTTCNVTECLFDINNDPCETKNIAQQYPRIARELDLFLEQYGRNVTRQVRVPVDWLADPRRTNGTWEPWMAPGEMFYTYNTATHLIHLAYCIHIGIILATVAWNVFI